LYLLLFVIFIRIVLGSNLGTVVWKSLIKWKHNGEFVFVRLSTFYIYQTKKLFLVKFCIWRPTVNYC
jgi:hypothetical protein